MPELGDARDRKPLLLRRTDIGLLHSVSRHRRVRPAAQDARITASAASRRLVTLSRELGRPLLVRDRGRCRLTTSGWLLYRSGRQLIDVLDHAIERARHDSAGVSTLAPVLRLSAAVGDDEKLMDLLSAWLPGIVVDLVPGTAGGEMSAFEQYRVDATCGWDLPSRSFHPRRPAQMLQVVTEPLWVALPAGHPRADDGPVSLRELAGETWIVSPSPIERALLAETVRAHQTKPGGVLSAASTANQRSLVAQGQGIALMSPLAAPRRDAAGFVLRPITETPSWHLYLAVDPLIVPPAVADRLGAGLRAHYAELAGALNPDYRADPSFPVREEQARPRPIRIADAHDVLLQRIGPPEPRRADPGDDDRTRLEPEHLHLLDVIDRAGSVNRAATELLVTQPALTRRLHRLEQRVGITLLNTSPQGSQLSEAARSLLADTQPARNALDAAVDQLRRSDHGAPPAGWLVQEAHAG
jgi:DNA-binding transcriptional LysR family regulator